MRKGFEMLAAKENRNEMNQLIQNIGNAVFSVREPNWEKSVVGYFIESSGISHLQFFELDADNEDYINLMELSWESDRYDNAIVDIEENCEKLHEFCSMSRDAWTSISFSVESNGAYNIDYGYEPIKTYDSQYILQWQSKYLD